MRTAYEKNKFVTQTIILLKFKNIEYIFRNPDKQNLF